MSLVILGLVLPAASMLTWAISCAISCALPAEDAPGSAASPTLVFKPVVLSPKWGNSFFPLFALVPTTEAGICHLCIWLAEEAGP